MKRIISTILTLSMLFTMAPAFASDIETSDVNNTLQLFSVGNGEAVIKKSADQLAMNVADFEEQEAGQLTIADGKTYNGTNFQVYSKPNGGTETYSIVEVDGNKYLKMDNAAGGYTANSSSIVKQNLANGKKVALTYKMKFDLPATDWLSININANSGVMSGSYVDRGAFGFNYGGDYSEANNPAAFAKYKGAVNKIFNVETDVWYTFNYLFDLEKQTYDFSVTSDKGDVEVLLTTKDGSDPLKDVPFRSRKTASTKVSDIVMYVPHNSGNATTTIANSFCVDDIMSYSVEEGVFFSLIGPETLADDSDMRIEYNNTTADDKDVCVTYVAMEDGVVVDVDEDIVTLATDENTADVDVAVDTTDCIGEVTYAAFVTDAETGATLCTKGSKEGTSVPADFVTVDEANGQLVVDIVKDVAYDAAIIRVFDEDDNLVGIKEQKVTTAAVKFDIKDYNQEYTADVILSDAAGNYAQDSDSIIVWNPTIAEDFNNDPEEAFSIHMDALEKAYPGFEEIFSENEDYIVGFVMMREDYTSVYDVVETVLSLQGFLEVMGAESEAAFARALENNADSLGIVIDNIYWNNKDAIIAKLYADKEDDAFIIPEELVEAYNNAYIVAEFNAAPAISYGRLLNKYASVLGIAVDAVYTEGEATINELIYQYKEDNGAFDDIASIAVAYKNAKNNAVDPVGYDTVATSPISKNEIIVDFESDVKNYSVSYGKNMEAYGSYSVEEENGNKYLRLEQKAGGEDAVTFSVNNLPNTGVVNVSERIKFEKLDTGYTFLRILGTYLYIENDRWGINYGGGKMITTGTLEPVQRGIWYTLNFTLDCKENGSTAAEKTFYAEIYDENGTLVFQDEGPFRTAGDTNMAVVTPHKDGTNSDGSNRVTTEDTVILVDDVYILAEPDAAVYYSAKAIKDVVAGSNGMAVAIENLTGEDRTMGVYVPVYVDGVLYTVACTRDYFENDDEKEIIVEFELPDDVDVSKVTYSVIVADDLGGVNHSVASKTAAGTLSIDTTVDYEKDTIKVTTDSTFDNGTIIVLAPGATLANAAPSDILYYAAGKNATVKVADGVKGNFKVYAIAQDMDGNVTKVNETVYYPGNGAAATLVADFADITDANVASVVAEHMSLINAIEPGIATFYTENSVEVNAALVANKPYADVEAVINTIKSVKALASLKAAATEAQFEDAFEDFADMFDVTFDSIYDDNKATFITKMYAQKNTFNTYEDVMNAYNAIYMIFDINTATANTIDEMLAKYATVLGINLDDVYASKKVYIDRLVADDMPFADADAVVSSYNNAYNAALALEGDFSEVVIMTNAQAAASNEYKETFESFEEIAGATSAAGTTFSFAGAGNGHYSIVSEDGNKFVTIEQSENTGSSTSAIHFKTASVTGGKIYLSYKMRFDNINNGWTMFNFGEFSSLYLSGKKFNLNESGSTGGGQKNLTGAISLNEWYTISYVVDVKAETYNIIIKDEDNNELCNVNTKTRYWEKNNTTSASLSIYTSQNDGELCQISIDDVIAYSQPASGTYYTVTGTASLLPGVNVFNAEILNADDTDMTYAIYVPMYVDGKLVSIDKTDVFVAAGETIVADVALTAPASGNGDYDVYILSKLDGVNYAVTSKAVAQRVTTPAEPVADYTARTIKVSGTTTNDNLAIVVTAPTNNSSVYDIQAANSNSDVIAYYNVADLIKVSIDEDPLTREKITTSSFAADIKIPDKFINGEYHIYFVSQNQAGQVDILRKKVYYAGSTKLDNMLTAFNAVTDANVEATINAYMDVLLGVASDMDTFYAANKAKVNEAVVADKPYSNVGDINNTVFSIYAIDNMLASADVATFRGIFEYYSNIFGIDVTDPAYIQGASYVNDKLYADKADITKSNISNMYTNALMLYEVNSATREIVDTVLNKYATFIGIDVNGAKYNQYKVFVAKTIAEEGVVFNSVQDVITAFNNGITLGENSESVDTPQPSVPVGGNGGGGGGSVVTNEKVYLDQPYVEEEKNVEGTSVAQAAFADLDTVAWAKEAITELKRLNIINGVSDTEFAPNREVTREEFAKMIVNAFAITGEGKNFTDVPATAWYAPYVTALASSGIVNGVSETKFGVGTKITRQDAAVILDRTALAVGTKYENRTSALNIFSDYIADYAVDSIYRLYQNGVINGTSATTFGATTTLTRAQAAKMIYSLMQMK